MVNTDVKMRSEETKAYMEASHGNPTVQLPKYLYLRSIPQRWMLDNLRMLKNQTIVDMNRSCTMNAP